MNVLVSKFSYTNNFSHWYFYSVAAVCLTLVVCYMYLLSSSVLAVVMQKETNKNIAILHTEIAQLETEFIDAQHEISTSIATLDGYTAATNKIFIDRSDTALVLSE